MTAFAEFERVVRGLAPAAAVVLGSGLSRAAAAFREAAAVGFGEVPGLVPPTVPGHGGRLAVGHWGATPALVFFGRLHYYEGHSPDVVAGPARAAAALGARRFVLTNAAGGIHPNLAPGELMAIRGHLKLIGPDAWRSAGRAVREPYAAALLARMPELLAGVYAALTGPCYETPAEIRAAREMGADAVGMSTALEAEAAAGLGLEVAGVSCVTNRAAGLDPAPLAHADVLVTAQRAADRLAAVIGRLLASDLASVGA
ncbi:MAG: purine-nucleoside phosphorylase [Isosphaera sp.]|nr:purine-nucleoside phosphorylase [Isosphaera sp.]